MVTFTGSNAVGAAVMIAAAPTAKKVVLELGGKSPTVILPGRRPGPGGDAVDPAVLPQRRAGVRRDHPDPGAPRRLRRVPRRGRARSLAALPVGDPHAEATEVGPLITAEHRDRVEGYLARAVDKGATVLAGGGRPDGSRRLLPGADAGRRRAPGRRDRPGRAVRPGGRGVRLRHRRRGGRDRQQQPVRAQRAGVGRPRRGAGGRRPARDRHGRRSTAAAGPGPTCPWAGAKQSGVGMDMGEDGFGEFFTVKHLQWPA